MKFEYDPNKSARNKLKHGLDFEEAKELWDDENLLVLPLRFEDEPRQACIGRLHGKYWTAIMTCAVSPEQAGVTILRTDELGTIVARTDGKEVTFTWDNQSANPENAEPAQPVQFIGNVNSHKFHAPDCANLPTEKNRIIFDTYEEAVNAGYTPCGSCLG